MSTTDSFGSGLMAGRYRLVERLGAGGMSVVWRGFDEVLGRQVAVKVLPPSSSADPIFRRRLQAEAQAAARLTHPNITNVYDYGEATTVDGEPVPFVVMELVQGESLAAVLARTRFLPWQHAVRIAAEVAGGLAAAHSRGIVHRDVTPSNVMLPTGGAKVVDFGISALIGENDIGPDGSLMGTPAYLAPERLEGGQVSSATDVYAVGLLIYRALVGQLPWDVGTTTQLLRAHQYVEPDPLPPIDGLPTVVTELIGRCLEKRPQDRPSSAELARVLAGIAAGVPAGPLPEGDADTTILPALRSYPNVIRVEQPESRDTAQVRAPRRPRRVLVAAATVLLLGAGTYVWSLTSRDHDRDAPGAVRSSGECVVAYAVQSDKGGQFTARMTVANRDSVPISDWNLWFILPGDQVLTNGDVIQAGNTVTVGSSRPLGAMKSVTMPVAGGYHVSNAVPLAFRLNNIPCEAYVSGKPGEPIKLVQRSPNGKVKLVPVASGAVPVPGVSVDPSGGVHLNPITITTAPSSPVSTEPDTETGTETASQAPDEPSTAVSSTTVIKAPPPTPPRHGVPTTTSASAEPSVEVS
ncbi:serine/threonine-protein kinase [Actinoplanes tereljensis]|nr:serine/threonine-protein kinase [Actinoplanes tereljensis]